MKEYKLDEQRAPYVLREENETEAAWAKKISDFVTKPEHKRRGIEIAFLYDTLGLVPQRLYSYELLQHSIRQIKKDRIFEYDRILAVELLPKSRIYEVYVIELDYEPDHVYVGQSSYSPELRLMRHLTHDKQFQAAKIFRGAVQDGTLRPDLSSHLPTYEIESESKKAEKLLSEQLREQGFRVEGGT